MITNGEAVSANNPESGREQRQQRLSTLIETWQEEGISLDEMLAVVDEEIEARGDGER